MAGPIPRRSLPLPSRAAWVPASHGLPQSYVLDPFFTSSTRLNLVLSSLFGDCCTLMMSRPTCTVWHLTPWPVAETRRRVWGDEKFFHGPRFPNYFFSEKISIFTAEISDDLFLVIDQVFRIFPFFSQIFRLLYYVKCRV